MRHITDQMTRNLSKFVVALLTLSLGLAVNAETATQHGSEFGESPLVDLATALANPASHMDENITVEGRVVKVCQTKGCWLELTTKDQSQSVRVKFENYGFFVPTDSAGQLARLEGKFVIETMSKRVVDHLIDEGASLTPREDGTVETVSFVARAVELQAT